MSDLKHSVAQMMIENPKAAGTLGAATGASGWATVEQIIPDLWGIVVTVSGFVLVVLSIRAQLSVKRLRDLEYQALKEELERKRRDDS